MLVWRKDVTVYHRPVDEAERTALGRAAEGTTFGALCEALAATLPPEEAITRAFAWLSTWLADELLVAVAGRRPLTLPLSPADRGEGKQQ